MIGWEGHWCPQWLGLGRDSSCGSAALNLWLILLFLPPYFLSLVLQPPQSFCDFPISFLFVPTVNYIDWVFTVELALHFWNKFHLVLIYYSFNTLLDSICIYVHKGYCLYFSCNTFAWVWHQTNAGLQEWVKKYIFFFPIFWKSLCRIGIISFLNVSQSSPVE